MGCDLPVLRSGFGAAVAAAIQAGETPAPQSLIV